MGATAVRRARCSARLALAASAFVLSACSLLVDTAGLATPSGDAGPGGAGDASSDARASIGDANAEGGAPIDGATDARFCSLHAGAALCIDFDDKLAASSYFGALSFDSRVKVAIGGNALASPSLSFDYAGGTLPNGYLRHDGYKQLVQPVQKTARGSVLLLVDRVDSSHDVRVLELSLDKNGGFISFFVNLRATSSNFFSQIYGSDGGYLGTTQTDLASTIAIGTAVRVEILVDASTSPGQATVLLDGQPASPPLTFDPQLVVGATPEISLHLTMYGKAGGDTLAPTTFHFDDALVEVE